MTISTSLELIGSMPSAWTVAVLGRSSSPSAGGDPKTSNGTRALTVIDVVAPATRGELTAVRKSSSLIDAVSKVLESTRHVNTAPADNWSVTITPVAGPAPVLLTVMVKDAVSPG